MVAHIQNDIAKTETLNMPVKIGIISTTLLVDSCSVCRFLKQSLASQGLKSSPHAFWVCDNAKLQLRTFSNEAIRIEGKVQTPRSLYFNFDTPFDHEA